MKKITLRILASAIITIASAILSFAQSTSGKIEGRVINERSEPMEFVNVLLRQSPDSVLVSGAITNADGHYAFDHIAHGNYIITLTFVGYGKQSIPIQWQDGSYYTVPVITLKGDTKLLGEVVVRAQKPLIEQEDGKLILHVQHSIIAAGGSAAELLERTPGVNIDQNNNQISLNGKAGVAIMIDGKLTYLPPAELLTMLRSMNANNVATIEVATNPSSRYDATGNSGIINIKMKKSTTDGFNGSAIVGTGYGRYGKANGNINLSYGTRRWTHFLNYGYAFNQRYYNVDTEWASPRDGDPIYFTQVLRRVQKLPSHTWQAGSEWRWNPNNAITLSTKGSYNQRFTDNQSYVQVRSVPGAAPDSTFTIANDQAYRWYNVSGSLGYRHIFQRANSELTVDADYADYDFHLNDDFRVTSFEKEVDFINEYNIVSDQPSSFHIYTGRADYTHPLSKQVFFETGMKYNYVRTLNNILFKNNLSGQYETDLVKSSDFNYTEQIAAAYANVKGKLLGFDAQIGFRTEQTQYQGFSVRTNRSIERQYTNFFPSMKFSRDVNENYRVGFAYSYRIDRPNYSDLYPYVYYFDPFDSQLGNPTLLPQFTHNFQVSQTLLKDYVVNVGYSNISQYLNFALLLNEDQKSIYSTKKNFDSFQNYYVTTTAPLRVNKNWTINVSLNLFYNKFNTQLTNETYSINLLSGTANIAQTITLPLGLTAEVTGIYNGPNMLGLFKAYNYGSLSAGLQKQLWNKKASLRLNVTDLFQSSRVRYVVGYPGLEMDSHVRYETRIVRLNFTWNMGKSSGRALRRRNTLEEEQKRIGAN